MASEREGELGEIRHRKPKDQTMKQFAYQTLHEYQLVVMTFFLIVQTKLNEKEEKKKFC